MLTEPISLPCGATVPNRLALAPLTNLQSHPDGTLSDTEYNWLVARARGGFGLVSTCATYISAEGKCWPGQLGASDAIHDPGLARLAQGLKAAGAFAVCQLQHGGAKADLAPRRVTPANMTETDIEQAIADFVSAAQRCEAAGFDGVEIHGANGYLITQFLAPKDNPRTDTWGADLPGRARFARQVMRAVRAAVSPGFAVGIRLSPVDAWTQRGLVLADGVQVGAWLAEDGADWVHCSLGDAAGPPKHEEGKPPVVRAMRDAVDPRVPVFAAGGAWTRADVERAMQAGADLVVVGRAGIGNADWAQQVLEPDYAPIKAPWTQEHLASQQVGAAFVEYLGRMGLVQP